MSTVYSNSDRFSFSFDDGDAAERRIHEYCTSSHLSMRTPSNSLSTHSQKASNCSFPPKCVKMLSSTWKIAHSICQWFVAGLSLRRRRTKVKGCAQRQAWRICRAIREFYSNRFYDPSVRHQVIDRGMSKRIPSPIVVVGSFASTLCAVIAVCDSSLANPVVVRWLLRDSESENRTHEQHSVDSMRISGHPTTVKNVVQGVKVYIVKALELFKLA